MPDLSQTVNNLRGLPDDALQRELTNPSGIVPAYLVLAEAQRRQVLRSAAQREQAQQQRSGSVYDDIVRSMMARQPASGPQAPVGMTPPANAPGTPPGNFRMPQQGNPMGMARGGSTPRSYSVDDWNDEINEAADRYQLDPAEIRAIMRAESQGNPNARSGAGAIGLMQLMPGTAKDLGVNPHNPRENILGGARYYRQQLDDFGGDRRLALAAYNAGPVPVRNYGRVPPFRQTQEYVSKIERELNQRQGSAFASRSGARLPRGPMTVGTGIDSPGEPEAPEAPAPVRPPTGLPRGPVAKKEEEPQDETKEAANTTDTGADTGTDGGGDGDAFQPYGQNRPFDPNAVTPGLTGQPFVGEQAPVPGQAPPQQISALEPIGPGDVWKLNAPGATLTPQMTPPQPIPVVDEGARRQDALRAEIERLRAGAEKLGKPNIWQKLAAFGFGMAASPSPFLGVQIGAGGQAMLKDVAARQEEARQTQLKLLGVDLDLDKEMQAAQLRTQQLHDRAVQQADKNNWEVYKEATKGGVPGGPEESPGPGYSYYGNPRGGQGRWVAGTVPVTPDLIPHLPLDPRTMKPYQQGDMIPSRLADQATRKLMETQRSLLTAKPTQAATDTHNAISQLFRDHQDEAGFEAPPLNEDGTPRRLTMDDVPAGYEEEVRFNKLIAKGGSKKLAEDIKASPNASPRLKQWADNFLTTETGQAAATTTATTTARLKATSEQKETERQAQEALTGPELNTGGQKQMGEIGTVGTQFDDLLKKLEPYKDNNNPLTLTGPLAKYKLGISTPEGQLGNELSNLSLASIQGMMPFATKSRNYQYIQEIAQHLPKLMHFPPDSPSLIYDKLLKARRNFLRMERNTLQWEQKKGGTNPVAPALDRNRAMVYYRLAGGDRDKARAMAQDDGWQIPGQ